MPLEILRQSNFTGGELDPAMLGRRDLKAYFASLAKLENLQVTPQGPLVQRPGLAHVTLVRNLLATVALTAAMVRTPNGGTAAHVVDAAEPAFDTTAPVGAAGYVVLEVEFDQPEAVHMIDLVNFGLIEAVDNGQGGVTPSEPVPPPFEYPWHDRSDFIGVLP